MIQKALAKSPSWVSTNLIFQKHPRLQLLHRCSSRHHLESVLAYAIVSGLFRNPFAASRILETSTLFSPRSFTCSIFARMTNPNVFSFNTMIKFAPSAALSFYVEMLERGMLPDKHTYPLLFKSLTSSSLDINIGKLVHAHVVMLGFGTDPFVKTALLSMYFACGAFGDALRLFAGICQRDVATWTAAISGFAEKDCYAQALCVFDDMRSQPEDLSVSPNVATMVSTISASAGLGYLDLAKSLHAYVEKAGFEHDVFVRNSLIDSYSKCGSMSCAWQVFTSINDKDLYSWTAMITGLASHGLGKKALDVFSWLQQSCVVPDHTTFVAVLTACSHAGFLDEGVKIFESMKLFNLKPELKHYGCMVDLFSRAGQLGRAYELVSNMPMEPNLVILASLLSGCRVHADIELAEIIVKKIEMTCMYHGGAHVLLSNMYADKNQWREVVSSREATKRDQSMPQGRSWIEVQGVVHEFGVDDTSTPLARDLHLVLDGFGKAIDEVGFIHPTQFPGLNEVSGASLPSTANVDQSADDILDNGKSELHVPQYDKTVFWNSNHKLAISVQVLSQLYNAALNSYMDVNRRYKQSTRSSQKANCFDTANRGADFDHILESEVLKHTKLLLILSYDFRSVWNSRKLVLLRKHELSLFVDEIHLSTLILSYAPKSESAWSHRRWAIKMIAEKRHDLQELIGKESELVKNIAEKLKMNYRAWNHRCWLVLYMTNSQVLDELNKSRKWAELHVADNCCFHYRRRLMLRILEDNSVEGGETSFNNPSDVYIIWKEELQWNELLIQRYIGREALWIHRRFLSQCWIKQFATDKHASGPYFDDFIGEELELLHACLSISTDGFDDGQSQVKHAVAYVMWISKQVHLEHEAKLHEGLKEAGGLKALLIEKCPEKLLLWENLLV